MNPPNRRMIKKGQKDARIIDRDVLQRDGQKPKAMKFILLLLWRTSVKLNESQFFCPCGSSPPPYPYSAVCVEEEWGLGVFAGGCHPAGWLAHRGFEGWERPLLQKTCQETPLLSPRGHPTLGRVDQTYPEISITLIS